MMLLWHPNGLWQHKSEGARSKASSDIGLQATPSASKACDLRMHVAASKAGSLCSREPDAFNLQFVGLAEELLVG